MDEDTNLHNLDSAEPRVRGLAAFKLRDSFDDLVGDRLVEILIAEHNTTAFGLICQSVVPKWIVRLERALASRDAWPIGPANTARLVKAIAGLRLPAYEQNLTVFFAADDWVVKLTAVEYCREKNIRTIEAKEVCDLFLSRQANGVVDSAVIATALGWGSGKHLSDYVKSISIGLTPISGG